MIRIPLKFYIGETFAPPPFLWQDQFGNPQNLIGFTSAFTARQAVQAGNPPLILATTGNGMESINGPAGSIQLVLPSSYTAGLIIPAFPFEGVWDQWVYSPTGLAYRLFGGILTIYQSVTRP